MLYKFRAIVFCATVIGLDRGWRKFMRAHN